MFPQDRGKSCGYFKVKIVYVWMFHNSSLICISFNHILRRHKSQGWVNEWREFRYCLKCGLHQSIMINYVTVSGICFMPGRLSPYTSLLLPSPSSFLAHLRKRTLVNLHINYYHHSVTMQFVTSDLICTYHK